MAYIGRQNLGGAYRQLDDISSGFDGSDTTHTMQVNSQNVTVGDVNQIILSLGGVIQKPGTDFTVSGSVLTFTTAPAANTSFFAILLGSDNGGTVTPTDGSVTTTKIVDDAVTSAKLDTNISVAGTLASTGVLTANAGVVVDNITIDGTEIDLSSGDLTVDVAGDITLDADGGDINFSDGGTALLRFTNSSSDVIIKPLVDAKDIIIHQADGTSLVEFNDGAYSKFTAMAYFPEATLTDASTISWNVLTSPVAKVTLGANRTLGAATGAQAGQFVSLLIIQDGTGSRTVTFNAVYEFKDDTAPTLTTTAAKGDLFVFRYNGSKFLEVGRNQNLTLS